MPCDEHVGDVFPPRCATCESEQPKTPDPALDHRARRLGFIPGTECPDHPGYPLPCDRCARDRQPHAAANQ